MSRSTYIYRVTKKNSDKEEQSLMKKENKIKLEKI